MSSFGIMTQKHHRLLPSPALEWFRLHFQQSGFNGRFQIGYRRPGSGAILPLTTQPLNQLPDFLESAHFSLRLDYYITANSFCGVKRQKEDLFSLHNIVIDIDYHCKEHMFFNDEVLYNFCCRLREAIFDPKDLPSPSSIVWTGRGLQLWWAIVPTSGRCLPWIEEIRDTLILRLRDLIQDYPSELEDLKVDSSASRNVVGYFRLPGTVNSRTQTLVKADIWNSKQYDTHNLIKWAKQYKEEREQEAALDRIHTSKEAFDYSDSEVRILKNVFTLAFFRARQIIRLRSIRNDDIGDETRNNMCLILYNAFLLSYGPAKAWEKVLEFNTGFKNPMTEKELHNSLDTSTKKGGYRYKNETIIAFLDITEAEQEQIELFPGGYVSSRLSGHPSRSAARRLAKHHRDQKVLSLSESGKSNKKIAEELGIAPNTVTSILGARRPRREEALEMKRAGMSTDEISAKLGVSKRTVERYISAAKKELFTDTEESSADGAVSAGDPPKPQLRVFRFPYSIRRRIYQNKDSATLQNEPLGSKPEFSTEFSTTDDSS